MKNRIRRATAILLCLCMTLFLLSSCSGTNGTGKTGISSATQSNNGVNNQNSDIVTVTPLSSGITFAASYDEIYNAIQTAAVSSDTGIRYAAADDGAGLDTGAPTVSSNETVTSGSPGKAVQSEGGYSSEEAVSSGGVDYSHTNTQVEGIDEGDIVKTDGKYIYILDNDQLLIASADGGSVNILSRTRIFKSADSINEYNEETGSYNYWSESEYSSELYVLDNYVAVITGYSEYRNYGTKETFGYENTTVSNIYLYDTADPGNPVLLHELSQDGSVLASRLSGDTLYLISSYYIYNYSEDDPRTFVPCVYDGGEKSMIAADKIAILPGTSSTSYTTIGAYDVKTGGISDSTAVYGAGSTVYMDADTLYVACTSYDTAESQPYTESVYTVVDYSSASNTHITSFDISGNTVEYLAYGSVPGYLESQFSMDEFNGYLRLVTTNEGYSYRIYTDAAYGFSNYQSMESKRTNALYVLDGGLSISGSITDLAEGESVYSARFDGDIGYFVTYETIDPLFAVDLSNPNKPTVLSALKIPGFSDYLHLYEDGLLFGLGYATDEEKGWTRNIKLTMFDTSDPVNVTEKHTLELEAGYSVALYNHKAILVSAEKDIIAFPTEKGFEVYGYDVQTGFYERAFIETDGWSDMSRGLYIGDWFYIVDVGTHTITVLDMSTFSLVDTMIFSDSSSSSGTSSPGVYSQGVSVDAGISVDTVR